MADEKIDPGATAKALYRPLPEGEKHIITTLVYCRFLDIPILDKHLWWNPEIRASSGSL